MGPLLWCATAFVLCVELLQHINGATLPVACMNAPVDSTSCCLCREQPDLRLCLDACPGGYYPTNTTTECILENSTAANSGGSMTSSVVGVTCAPCDAGCTNCTGPGPSSCIQCADGYTFGAPENSTSIGLCSPQEDGDIGVIGVVVPVICLLILLAVFATVCFLRDRKKKRPVVQKDTTKECDTSVSMNRYCASASPPPLDFVDVNRTNESRETSFTSYGARNSPAAVVIETPERLPSEAYEEDLFHEDASDWGSFRRARSENANINLTITNRSIPSDSSFRSSVSYADHSDVNNNVSSRTSEHSCPAEEDDVMPEDSRLYVLPDIHNNERIMSAAASSQCPHEHEEESTRRLFRPHSVHSTGSIPRFLKNFWKSDTLGSNSSGTATSGYVSDRRDSRTSSRSCTLESNASLPVGSCASLHEYDLNLAKDFSKADPINCLRKSMLSASTQTLGGNEDTEILPVFSGGWQFSRDFSSAGGVLQGKHSDVLLQIPENAVEQGEAVNVRGAVCTDIESAYKNLQLPVNENIMSPIVEYFAGSKFWFRKPVWIVLPHFLPSNSSTDDIRVYSFSCDSGRYLDTRCLAPISKDKFERFGNPREILMDTNLYFLGENENEIYILTDHFSGYLCTSCKESFPPPALTLELYAKHVVTSEGGRQVDVRLEIWDSRFNIKDFREQRHDGDSIHERHMQLVDRSKTLRAMESEEELTNVELLASLSDEEDQHWMHRKRRNGELFLPTESTMKLECFVPCKCPHRIPQIVDWQLVNIGEGTPDRFHCIVDAGYARCENEERSFIDHPKKVSFCLRIAKCLEMEPSKDRGDSSDYSWLHDGKTEGPDRQTSSLRRPRQHPDKTDRGEQTDVKPRTGGRRRAHVDDNAEASVGSYQFYKPQNVHIHTAPTFSGDRGTQSEDESNSPSDPTTSPRLESSSDQSTSDNCGDNDSLCSLPVQVSDHDNGAEDNLS